tara:strand:- start:531 stop:1343 length:813 start_codon:yes stop_codon:yes gene_type:complete
MSNNTGIITVDNIDFELRPNERFPSKPDRVCLRKPANFTDRYLALAEEFQECRMVEIGVDRGGSTSFFLKLLKPQGLLALELSHRPVATVMDFLKAHDAEKRVNICWGVDQADEVELPRLVEEMFDDQPLDLVIDDASHLLVPTTSTFEILFPRLRAGGLYIIEDWSSKHLLERRLALEKAENPEGEIARRLNAAEEDSNYKHTMPMSLLCCQLLIASGRNPDWIAEVRATDGFCEIRRGEGKIPSGTGISGYLGAIGSWMFARPEENQA